MENYQSEFVIGLTCAVGTDILPVKEAIQEELQQYGYNCQIVKISKNLLEPLYPSLSEETPYQRSMKLMDLGNSMRLESRDNAILAKGAIHQITDYRDRTCSQGCGGESSGAPVQATAYIIDSLKNPEEVKSLREVYASGFYLFAINEAEQSRLENLIDSKNMGKGDAQKLVDRDLDEALEHGQKTRRVFELADFHLSLNGWKSVYDADKNRMSRRKNTDAKRDAKKRVVKGQLQRIIQLLFANPFITPTFDEFAMFMAYSSALRSADLSRQIGAVITTAGHEIVATGANDCPKYGGGQYWMSFNPETLTYEDEEFGRDYKRGYDSNKREYQHIVDEIVDMFDFPKTAEGKKKREKTWDRIYQSRIKLLTEYGRPVHAEMAAILSCARTGISLQNATLYCSTFPCHNCAKHIIGAGIKRVVYIEPYPKSKSVELYSDAIELTQAYANSPDGGKVQFEEFVGIGPRRFYDLFSMGLSSGSPVRRKKPEGNIADWDCKSAKLRCIMAPSSYFDREAFVTAEYLKYLEKGSVSK